MKQLHLRSFIAVVERGGFRPAAKHVGISQPSLSQHIGHLEDHVGVALFDRLPEGVRLTRAGDLLYERAKIILGLIDETREIIADGAGEAPRKVSVSAIPTIAPCVLPAALGVFSRLFERLTVRVAERTTDDLYEAVVSGRTDIGVASTLPESSRAAVTAEHLADEPLVLAMAAGSEWAARPHLCAEDLQRAGVIVLGELHCLSGQVSEFCATRGIDRVVRIESGQIATVIELVRRNVGVTLLPVSTLKSYNTECLTVRAIKDGAPSRPILMVRNRHRPQSELTRALARCISETYERVGAADAAP